MGESRHREERSDEAIWNRRRGLGRLLLRDAILRTQQAAAIVGVRGLLVHALSPEAKRFYEDNGFQESPASSMTLLVALKDAMAAFGGDTQCGGVHHHG